MGYLSVKDLKKTKELWTRLEEEREVIITRDGKPCAIIVGVSPESVEQDLGEIRRALFSAAVTRARQKAKARRPSAKALEQTIRESRRQRAR